MGNLVRLFDDTNVVNQLEACHSLCLYLKMMKSEYLGFCCLTRGDVNQLMCFLVVDAPISMEFAARIVQRLFDMFETIQVEEILAHLTILLSRLNNDVLQFTDAMLTKLVSVQKI